MFTLLQKYSNKIMKLLHTTTHPGRLSKSAHWTRALLATLIATTCAYSADLAKWSFTSPTSQPGDQVSTPVTTIDSSVQSASGITRGSGVTATTTPNSMNSSGWATTSTLDVSDYYQFTITPVAGTILNIDTLHFAERRSGTGISKFELRSSLDSYSSTVGSVVIVPDDTATRQQTITLGSAFDSISSSVTFRLFGYASEASGGTWRLENNTVKSGVVLEGNSVPPLGALSVSVATNPIFESGGATSTSCTVTRTGDMNAPLTVNLSSSDPLQATVSSPSVVIPALEASAAFSVTAINDTNPDGNVAVTISASAALYISGTASLTVNDDGDLPAVVISQYYEGAPGTDRYIELYNPNGTAATLTGYVLTSWNNGAAESWKSNGNTPNNQVSLSSVTVPANGYYLIKGTDAVIPSYAASSADLTDSLVVSGFNGNDSVVLYSSNTFSTGNIIDAVSFTNTGNEGLDTSFYRTTNTTGYNLTTGSTVKSFPAVWTERLLSDVNTTSSANAWYLKGSTVLETLTLTFTNNSIVENAGAAATMGHVARTGPTTAEVVVNISVNDLSEASAPLSVTILAGSAFADFPIAAVDDSIVDGSKIVTITVQAASYLSDSKTITVQDDGLDPATFTNLVINEVDSDTPGSDTAEFVELFNKSNQSQSLNGLILVFYNGGDISSYRTIDLSGQTIPANGFFVIGNSGVANVGLTFPNGTLQNGADAVALYAAEASQILNGTLVTAASATLVDAVVYDNTNPDNTALIGALTPSKPQIDENTNSMGSTQSISRVPNGGAAFDTTLYVAQAPSPGATNVLAPSNTFSTWISGFNVDAETGILGDYDKDGLSNALENIFGSSPEVSNTGITQVSGTATSVTFRHNRADAPVSDLTPSYQWSTDLINWYPSGMGGGITVTIGAPVVITNGSPNDLVEVTATVTSGTTAKLFVRLKVTNP